MKPKTSDGGQVACIPNNLGGIIVIRIKSQREYEVWCKNCQHVLVFDSPEDLKKENKPDSYVNPMYCLVCPSCGREIWFDGLTGYTLGRDFCEQVKFTNNNKKEATVGDFQKKLEEFDANLQADSLNLF